MPSVQTKIAHYFTEKINKKHHTNIAIDQIAITPFGIVKLKKVMIKDAQKDTLIYASRITTNVLDFDQLIDGNLLFGSIDANDLKVKIITYKGEKDTSLDKFIDAFDDGKKSSGKFLFKADKIDVENGSFMVLDYNRTNSKDVDFTKLNTVLTAFMVKGPNVTTKIKSMAFHDHRGLEVRKLSSQFSYTKQNIKLEKLTFKTDNSNFDGAIILKYNRSDFADFNNKVIFDVNTNSAKISSTDVKYFYKEMGKNQEFKFSGKIDGTLNNITAKNFKLTDNFSIIDGDITFKNLFAKPGKGEFFMDGKFKQISSSYQKLCTLLPNVLGKNLPVELKKLGNFKMVGNAKVTTNTIDTKFNLNTLLGAVNADIKMANIKNIDNAVYKGTIGLQNFDLGKFINQKDLGKTTLNIDIDGKGFTQKYLNTTFDGNVKNINYNGYTYQNVLINGSFKKPYFKGNVTINDPNVKLDFDGIVDLNKNKNIYNFKTKIDYVDLNKINLIKGQKAIFRGDVEMKVTGTTINNMSGEVHLNNASFQNSKDIYSFENAILSSRFDANNERTISIKTPNTINGEIQGKFNFNQLKGLVTNSLGSLYRNYKLDKINKGQYLKFNIKEFNKIVALFYPDIKFDTEASVSGSINGDSNDLKFNFSSKFVEGFEVHLDNVAFQVDNKNPLYNTYLEIDSVKTKYYDVRNFSMINTRSNDTLNFRTEFKGGKTGTDFYNLNLYHTIDKDKKNVVGFNKSEMMFKDYLWYINEVESTNSRIVFDNKFNNFTFDKVIVSHENQSFTLNGFINGKNDKELQLSFIDVNLNKITPEIKQFDFEGKLNGNVFLKQHNAIYQPTADIQIDELVINDNALGNLDLSIEGDNDFQKFIVDAAIENENFKSLTADGAIQIINKETVLDLNLDFQKFNLGILGKIAGDVLTNLRGNISGNAKIKGNINDINYGGKLLVNDAGFTIPFLGVDYKVKNQTVVDVNKTSFEINKTKLIDSKHLTEGDFYGSIKHQQFGNWKLNLDIKSNRILVLNTKDHEDAAFFGTAFIDGEASIVGPINGLVIKVDATSEKGTTVKIPINDATATDENSFIRFITKNEKYGLPETTTKKEANYNGLQMFFDFRINKNAEIEVILDRETGHGMKGVGDGDLTFRINTLGSFNMWGDFVVSKGSYNFKYGGLIDKKFEVKKDGYISWAGDPFNAALNLEAIYKTTANPGVLLDNSSINQKTPVEVVIGIKGTIFNPEPDFNFDFTSVSSVIKAEIETKLSDKDTRSKQAMVLLSTGGFLSTEGLSVAQSTNFLSETAGSILGNLFNDDSGKMNFGFNYYNADKSAINPTDGRVEATISSQLSDRITINGKVGVPVGGVTESTIVGNFELQYRVNEDGTLRLRVFNRENDITYIGQGVGYTQGLGVYYEVDFDTFKELINKLFKKNKLGSISKKTNKKDNNDKPLPSNDINLQENEKSNQPQNSTQKINNLAIPKED